MPTPYDKETSDLIKPRYVAMIPRWSVVPVVRRQTNGEHIFLVARYAGQIAKDLGYDHLLTEVYEYALSHDDAEASTGDLPSGSPLAVHKDRSDEKQYHPSVVNIVRMADRLEAYLYMCEERKLGNTYMDLVAKDLVNKLAEAADTIMGGLTWVTSKIE